MFNGSNVEDVFSFASFATERGEGGGQHLIVRCRVRARGRQRAGPRSVGQNSTDRDE